MPLHNQVDMIGTIVSEPELLPTRIGRPKLQFRLAVRRPPEMPPKWEMVDGRKVRRPDHVTVIMLGRDVAEVHRYLARGSRVLVVGGLISRDVTVNGEARTVNEVLARRIEFLDPRSDQGIAGQGELGGPGAGDHDGNGDPDPA